MRLFPLFLLLFFFISVQPVFGQPKLFIEQGMLSIETDDGKVFAQHAVKGAEIVLPNQVKTRIEDVIEKVTPTGDSMFFYQLALFDTASQQWQPYCEKDPKGQQLALLYYGDVDKQRGYQPGSQISITCSAGVIAKCMTWGYSPYAKRPNAVALFNTCLHMARADYCGNGIGYTRNGTLINIYDRFGIQKKEEATEKDEPLAFEAAWGENGALCVHHSRIQENIDIERLIAVCPEKFSPANTGKACSPEKYPDALIYNDSKQTL